MLGFLAYINHRADRDRASSKKKTYPEKVLY